MTRFEELLQMLPQEPKTWLVTGVAGFIGSNLLETLLKLDQRVLGLDNFATGYERNLDEVQTLVRPVQWDRFTFIKGDICATSRLPQGLQGRRLRACTRRHWEACRAVLPIRSPPTPPMSTGFVNMLVAARDASVKRFVYAASSSTYGDHPGLPKVEDAIGRPLSPYAVTKYVNELYADVFARCYEHRDDRLAVFQCIRSPARSRGSLCGGRSEVDRQLNQGRGHLY